MTRARVAIWSLLVGTCGGSRATGPATLAPTITAPPTAQDLMCQPKVLGKRDVLAVVTWRTPLPQLTMGVERPGSYGWCEVPPTNDPVTTRFVLAAHGTSLRYLVTLGPSRWVEFTDEIACDEGTRIDVAVETRLTADEQLVFATTLAGKGCRPAHTVRQPTPFAAETWPPHTFYCRVCGQFPWEE
jgi:hypothetical protein